MSAISLGPFLRDHHWNLRLQRFARIGWDRHQQCLFAIDQIAGVKSRQLEAVAMGNGVRGAGLNAITAEDAAVVVNVIDLGVALRAADAVLFRVLRRLNVNTVGRACRRAQKTGHALFQAVLIALQFVQTAKTFLENRAFIGQLLVGIVLNNGGREHLPQRYGHSFGNAEDIAEDRHAVSITVGRRYWEHRKQVLQRIKAGSGPEKDFPSMLVMYQTSPLSANPMHSKAGRERGPDKAVPSQIITRNSVLNVIMPILRNVIPRAVNEPSG